MWPAANRITDGTGKRPRNSEGKRFSERDSRTVKEERETERYIDRERARTRGKGGRKRRQRKRDNKKEIDG